MEIHININKDLSEDTVNFSIKEMTPELSQIINNLQNLNFKIVANRSGKNYQLDFNDIVTIYSENKKIIVFTEDKQQYFLNGSLKILLKNSLIIFWKYQVPRLLTTKITCFEFTFGGKVKIYFKNKNFTYSSRSYLKNIRRFFGLWISNII